jgi:CheY-like chemotaxis protein
VVESNITLDCFQLRDGMRFPGLSELCRFTQFRNAKQYSQKSDSNLKRLANKTVYAGMPVSLVVDDEPAVRKFISVILQQENFETLEAEDGAHGLQVVQDLDGELDLIVSDIQMPKMDGVTFAQSVAKSHPAVPIVLISGQTKPDGSFEFVEKPFSPGALMKAVKNVLARKACNDPE